MSSENNENNIKLSSDSVLESIKKDIQAFEIGYNLAANTDKKNIAKVIFSKIYNIIDKYTENPCD